jgi:hypothetical protein
MANNAQNFRFCEKWPPSSCQLDQRSEGKAIRTETDPEILDAQEKRMAMNDKVFRINI